MQLILVRHAVAEDREDFKQKSLDDSQRPLTLKGRKKMQKVAIRLREMIDPVDRVVTSPYVRARQTAEILAQIFFETPVSEAAELVPHSPPAAFVNWLKAHAADAKTLFIVGHEPQLSSLATYLLAGRAESVIELKKSAALSLEIRDPEALGPKCAILNWLIPPKAWVD